MCEPFPMQAPPSPDSNALLHEVRASSLCKTSRRFDEMGAIHGGEGSDGWVQDVTSLSSFFFRLTPSFCLFRQPSMSLRLQPGLSQEIHQPLIGTHGVCLCGFLPALSMGNPVAIVTETLHILICAARDEFLERLDGIVKSLGSLAER